jgi:hypothetical protein
MNKITTFALLSLLSAACRAQFHEATPQLWRIYENLLKDAKYVDLTHTITPSMKAAIDDRDWTAAALSSHRSSSRPERNEWTRKLFEQAALETGPTRHLRIHDGHLRPPALR